MSAPNSTASPKSGPGLDDDVFAFEGAARLLRTWSRGISPDPDLTVSEWAEAVWKLLHQEQPAM
jgi:hypothetical protein